MATTTYQRLRTRPPGKRAVRSQLERITASPEFESRPRSAEFLRFVVHETLDGREQAITQHTIAEAVFGRGEGFDPATDPIVRSQAGRVRRSLDRYYLADGVADPIRIDLPKGTYTPAFSPQKTAGRGTHSMATPPQDTDAWPTLLVMPFRNQTACPEVDFVADGVAYDLAAQLSRYAAFQVFLATHASVNPGVAPSIRFEVGGSIGMQGGDLGVKVHLVDRANGGLMWARDFSCPDDGAGSWRLSDAVEATAAMIAEENGLVANRLLGEVRGQPIGGSEAYAAILRHHHYEATRSPQAFVEALEALQGAVEAQPDCALCWSYLARLGAIHWSLGLPGEAMPMKDAVTAARRGVALDPSSVPARLILSYALLLDDEVEEARKGVETALHMNGGSIFWLDAIGYLLTLSGNFEQGPELIRRAIQLNPYHRSACRAGLWLDALRRADGTAALEAARGYDETAVFWHPLMLAVALMEPGEVDTAVEEIRRLLELKPDFSKRGHWLITRYVKHDDLVRKIETALDTAGLALQA